jgi:hypothetical protein
MNCDHCHKITTSVKKMEFCDHTLFHHICSYGNFCLECRIITQICIEEYDNLTNFLEEQVNQFSLRITKDMRLNCK